MTPAEEAQRGMYAQELLNNALLNEALKVIEDEVIAQWEQCPARDKEGKDALWQLFKTSKKFRNILAGYVETGKLAREKLKPIEERRGILSRLRA
jgi:ribosomal protein S17E